MIEFREETHVLGVWFLGTSKHKFDWLAVVTKQPGESYKGIYRFRYHKDAKAFDSADEKSWYTVDSKSEDKAEGVRLRQTMGVIARKLAEEAEADEMHYLPLDCLGPEATERLAAEKWSFMRPAGPEDEEWDARS